MEQRSSEWFADRLGAITGSRAHDLLSSATTRKTLMANLVREYATASRKEFRQTAAMERGQNIEDEATNYYAMMNNVEVEQAGIVWSKVHPLFGCSPDGLIGNDGGIEIKRLDEENHIKVIIAEQPEKKYIHQIEWCLFCTDRKWWDYVGYCETLPQPLTCYTKRITLNEEREISIKETALKFIDDLEKTLILLGLGGALTV